MSSPSQPSERMAVMATIDPANLNNSTATSDAVDMSKFDEAIFILIAGAIDNTVDFKLEQSDASGFGSGVSDVTGKAITQETGGDDDNKQWVINLKAEEMTKRYVRASVTVGNGTTNIAGLVGLGLRPRYAPASNHDLASVSQIIT